MAEFQLQYADATGQVHNQVVQGTSDQEVRERFSRQGYLVYGVKAKGAGLVAGLSLSGRKKLNLEKFLIFNQQFVTQENRSDRYQFRPTGHLVFHGCPRQ